MKKHRFIQFFCQGNQFLKKVELVFFFREHAIIVETGFTDSDDFRIGRDDAPDFLDISLRRGIGHMRMNAGRTKYLMSSDKIIDQSVFPIFGTGQDTADAVGFSIGNDFLRIRKRPRK